MSTLDRPVLAGAPSRRIVFQGLGALGVAVALAGCGGGGSSSESSATPDAGTALTPTADVPVGGGIVLADAQLVVTQPTEGDFVAYTAVCTHQGSLVTEVNDGVMVCTTHGSEFSVEDGAVVKGPATEPLAEVEVRVDGDQVVAV